MEARGFPLYFAILKNQIPIQHPVFWHLVKNFSKLGLLLLLLFSSSFFLLLFSDSVTADSVTPTQPNDVLELIAV
jgi:hypothetical protein